MPRLGSLWLLIALDLLIGSIAGYVLWPICARAFHGPFESAGYLVAWPVSIAVALTPLFYFSSGFLLMTRRKAGFTFLFVANTVLLIVLALFSLYMHFVAASSKVAVPEAWILPQAYAATASIFVLSVLSVWFFLRKSVRAILKDTKQGTARKA